MASTTSSYTSLCSLLKVNQTKQNPSSCSLLKVKNHLPVFRSFCSSHLGKASILVVKAQAAKAEGGKEEEEEKYEEYEVEIVQPYGLKFTKGRDGGTYIDAIAPGGFADKTGMFSVGDKVLATRYSLFLPFCFF